MQHEAVVFRSIAFPVSAFDYLKDFQRQYKRQHGIDLTNNKVIAIILKEHQQTSLSANADGTMYEVKQ